MAEENDNFFARLAMGNTLGVRQLNDRVTVPTEALFHLRLHIAEKINKLINIS